MVGANPIAIFDRTRLRRLRNRRAGNARFYDFLAKWAGKQLEDRLLDINRNFENALSIGPFPFSHEKIKNVFQMDLAENLLPHNGEAICADEEYLPFYNSLDLIVSNLTLHAVNDLPGALVQIRRALKPDGLFLAALPGGETLHELRASLSQAEIALKSGISPRVFPFADKQQMGALMQRAGFALPVVDSDIITATYGHMHALMHDLRGMAATNIILSRNVAFTGREFFLHAASHYSQNFSEPDGKLPASFEIIFLAGWAPHESQQKPLKPGSAIARLSDVLGTDETKLQ